MKAKKTLPLVIALALGLISAHMVVKIIQGKNNVQVVAGPKLVKVVVVSKDLPVGENFQDGDLIIGEIVADSAPGTTFSDPAELAGRVPAAPLVHGQVVLESLLAPKGSGTGFQALIPDGMRAVTIDVNEVSGVADYIAPGCRVDIIQTLHDDILSQNIDRCLVQNVLVSAVGMRPRNGADPGPAHSVTLLVTPRQAELIDLASANGRPRLVLRNAKDQQMDDVPEVTLAELTGAHAPRPAPVVQTAATKPAGDPFAATTPATRPAVQSSAQWEMRIITAGEPRVMDVNLPHPLKQSSVTGADEKDAGAP